MANNIQTLNEILMKIEDLYIEKRYDEVVIFV